MVTHKGPTELSVLMKKSAINTKVRFGTEQSLEYRILQTADEILQLAHMLQTGKSQHSKAISTASQTCKIKNNLLHTK